MTKTAETYRKIAYKMWREKKDLKRQLQESQRTATLLRNSVQELNSALIRRRIRQEFLQRSFEKWTASFSEELKGRVKYTARKSTAARDVQEPLASSESSSEFDSPESDVDSVDLAREQAHKKARHQEAEAVPDTPASPDT